MKEEINKLINRYKSKIEWLQEHSRHIKDRHVDDCVVTWKSMVIDLEDLRDKIYK